MYEKRPKEVVKKKPKNQKKLLNLVYFIEENNFVLYLVLSV